MFLMVHKKQPSVEISKGSNKNYMKKYLIIIIFLIFLSGFRAELVPSSRKINAERRAQMKKEIQVSKNYTTHNKKLKKFQFNYVKVFLSTLVILWDFCTCFII